MSEQFSDSSASCGWRSRTEKRASLASLARKPKPLTLLRKKTEKLNSPSSLHSDIWNGLNSTFPPPWARENVLLLIFSGIQSVSMGPQENLPPFPPFRPLPCFPAFPASPASLLPCSPCLHCSSVFPAFPAFHAFPAFPPSSLLFPCFFRALSLLGPLFFLCVFVVFPLFCFASLTCLSLEVWSTARKGTAKTKPQKEALRGSPP